MEKIQVKEKTDTFTDPISEAFYRNKEAYPTKLISLQELCDYLKSFQTELRHPIENLCIHHLDLNARKRY